MRPTDLKNQILKSNKGVSIVIFAITLTFIAAFAAAAIDVGAAMAEKSKLSASVDAAALAGMQEMLSNSGNVENVANNYMSENIGTIKAVDTDIVDVVNFDKTKTRTVTVTGTKTAGNYFLKIFGLSLGDINASATAKAGSITSINGIRPLSIVKPENNTFSYDVLYTLKEGGGDGSNGSYGIMRFGDGTGASDYEELFRDGYNGPVHVGDILHAEEGNKAGKTEVAVKYLINQCNHIPKCTYLSYNPQCPRIIFIPVIDALAKDVTVVGFATFFLEGATNKGNSDEVYGRFIKYNLESETSSEISENDYGTYGLSLIK